MRFKIVKASFSVSSQLFKNTKSKLNDYYAVFGGLKPGIYRSWDECKKVINSSGVEYKKFKTLAEAEDFIIIKKLLSKSKNIIPEIKSNDKSNLNDDENSDEDRIDIYTDGACSKNGLEGSKAGIGVFFGDNHPLNVSKPVKSRVTNNCAEIEAVTEAAKIAKKNGMTKIRIHTDSLFLINCYTKWLKVWKGNGWITNTKRPVANKSELENMDAALEKLNVKFKYIRGHSGSHGNDMADFLARSSLNRKSTKKF